MDYERKKRKGGNCIIDGLVHARLKSHLARMLKEAKETGRVIDRVHGTCLKPYL